MHALVPPAPRGAPRSDRSTRDQGYLNLRGLVVRFFLEHQGASKKKKMQKISLAEKTLEKRSSVVVFIFACPVCACVVSESTRVGKSLENLVFFLLRIF